jgi:hypothetical protein
VLQYKYQFLEYILTIINLLGEIRQLKENQTYLVAEQRLVLHVHQGNVGTELIRNIFTFEIEMKCLFYW